MRIKKRIKKIGRSFFILKQEDRVIGQGNSILIVDNGYSSLEQLCATIEKMKGFFPQREISVLSFKERIANLEKDFPTVKFILPSERLRPKKYQLALQMLMMRKNRYDIITLLSLDITPIISSLFFPKANIILYNQWGQWWSIKPKPIRTYLWIVPLFILNIIIFVYLLISVFLIFLKMSFNVFRLDVFRKKGCYAN